MKTKLLYSASFYLLLINASFAQVSQDELIPASDKSYYLDVNNISSLVTNGSYLWENQAIGHGEHKTKEFDAILGYGASIWMGGEADGKVLKLAAELYSRDFDYYVGPYSRSGVKSDFEKYNRSWKINRWEVEQFVANYQNPNYTIPEVILNWPAHGDEDLGQAQNLAPFHDSDGDGDYNPYKGDYPEFDLNNELSCDADKLFGDQVIYTIFHDHGLHTESGGNSIGAEIHMQAYAFVSDDEINNTIFYKYDIYNRSTVSLKEFFFGFYSDSDIGCSGDDFGGFDLGRGLSYVFNGTLEDGAECFGAIPWISSIKPIMGLDFVKSPLPTTDRYSYFERGGTGPIFKEDPTTAVEFYNYMNSIFIDNTHFYLGGTGHYSSPEVQANGLIEVNYRLNDNIGWDEVSIGNAPGDRRSVTSVGPVDFNPGDKLSYTMAVLFDYVDVNGSYTNYDEIDKLKLTNDKIQTFADNCFSGVGCLPPQAQMDVTGSDYTYQFAYPFEATEVTWLFGDGTSATGRFVTHTYASLGDYPVCMTVKTDCGEDTFCEQISTVLTNDEIVSNIFSLSISPNPNKGNGVMIFDGLTESVKVNFYDISGKVILSKENIISERVRFELPKNAAIYIYEVVNKEGVRLSGGKIIVE